MTVRVYKSTDGSAPVLTGQVGKLTDLLDAVLVNGYGAKTAAGWTIGQTTANKRSYVQGAGSSGFSLYVDDNGPGAGAAKEARVAGFETMSAVTPTGTGQFPTGAQSAIGFGALVIRKSTTADATARAWTIVADSTAFMLFVDTGDFTGPTAAFPFYFGDIFSYGASDTSKCLISGRQVENSAAANSGTTAFDGFSILCAVNDASNVFLSQTVNGNYMARSFNNVGGSIAVGKHTDQTKMGSPAVGSVGNGKFQMGYAGLWTTGGGNTTWPSNFAYPNGPDQGVFMAPVWIHHNGSVRGYMKGLWSPLQHLPMGHGDTFTGSGNLAGKSFEAKQIFGVTNGSTGSGGYAAQCFVETSDTWA